MIGFYIGGMGSKKRNFHKELMGRFGYEAEAQKIQDLFLDGKREEAIATVPNAFLDDIYLVGSVDRVRDRLQAWKDSPVTRILVPGNDLDGLRSNAELLMS
jgi:alkanesulfonate monooxygenase SsuD/methylene tetrahydromethanopterin reductase-like flavin-dependent oxidoreductase (luciferase family)